jgi:hypothetical protein
MHDTFGMGSGKSIGNAGADLSHLTGRAWSEFYSFAKSLTFEQFHNRVLHPGFLPKIKDGHDVGMRESGDGESFPFEPR